MLSGTSATCVNVRLERGEVEALATWHSECEQLCADKAEYRDADEHQARAAYLLNLLK